SLGWRLEKPRSVPGSVSLLRAHGWSILSMPSAPGSSCVGISPPLQAHLVLDKTSCCNAPRHGCKLLRVNGPEVFLANPRFAGFGICAGVCGGSSLSGTG